MTDPISHALSASPSPPRPNTTATTETAQTAALRRVAQELEASFLGEMLKHAGFGEGRSAFGGGAGEAQFASFLRAEHARALVERGGIGLSQSLFEALANRPGAESGAEK